MFGSALAVPWLAGTVYAVGNPPPDIALTSAPVPVPTVAHDALLGVTPVPTTNPLAPAGDPGTAYGGTDTVTPSADPYPEGSALADPLHDAGPVSLTVRVCVDLNGDNRPTLGEGVRGLPVAVLDAATGDVLATVITRDDGTGVFDLQLIERTSLSVDAPFLGRSETAWPGQRGVDIVLPAVVLPEVLP
jgi:hypothetical protein